MDFSRLGVDRLNVEFKDLKSGNMTQRAFAEVILIDRTNPESKQNCYILKNDSVFNDAYLEHFQQGLYNLEKDDFLLIGDVLSINKKQKYVTLKDQNSISYNHLIIATGSNYSMIYEFINGVNTLVDAMRVRKKIPSAFPDAVKPSTNKRKMKSSKTETNDFNSPKKIENTQSRKISSLKTNDSSSSLNNPNKRLYEVQI
jgi:hypothetical protein